MAIDELTSLSSEEKIRILKKILFSLDPSQQINVSEEIIEHVIGNSPLEPRLERYGRKIGPAYIQAVKDMIFELKNGYDTNKHLAVCFMIKGADLFGIEMPDEVIEFYKKIEKKYS